MRAMILAAGYGTRLFPLTADRAKPALPFLNQPLVGYVANYLSGYGVRDVLVNLHHQGESVRRALGDGARFNVRTHFIEEPEILGTSGALDNARDLLDKETFLAVNGKIITDIDLHAALQTHRRTNALATLVLRRNLKRERFSIVHVDGDLIQQFGGMPAPPPAEHESGGAIRSVDGNHRTRFDDAPLMFTGIQILEPRIFDYIPRGIFSHSTTDVYPPAIQRGERIVAHIAEGNWYELSTPERYLDISLELAFNRSRSVTDDAKFMLSASGAAQRVIANSECAISANATMRDSILWQRVVIEDGARVCNSIIADDVHVASSDDFNNVMVVRAELVKNQAMPDKAARGEFRGNNFVAFLAR